MSFCDIADAIDRWFEDLQHYEQTLEEMAAASLDQVWPVMHVVHKMSDVPHSTELQRGTRRYRAMVPRSLRSRTDRRSLQSASIQHSSSDSVLHHCLATNG